MPSELAAGERRRRAPPAPSIGLLLGLLAVLDDVALLEQDALGDLAPERRAAQQELEVHAEVLELLALRVAHDRPRLAVGLDREALLVPADRLGLLGQRGAQARERPRLGRQLLGRLVVLVEPIAASCHAAVARRDYGADRSRPRPLAPPFLATVGRSAWRCGEPGASPGRSRHCDRRTSAVSQELDRREPSMPGRSIPRR